VLVEIANSPELIVSGWADGTIKIEPTDILTIAEVAK
jgi:hypothetical protein